MSSHNNQSVTWW